jgi:hypothetical protein
VGFVVDEVALEQFYSSTSVSPANSHSTDCSTVIIYHPGLVVDGVQSELRLPPPQESEKK